MDVILKWYMLTIMFLSLFYAPSEYAPAVIRLLVDHGALIYGGWNRVLFHQNGGR